MHAVATASVSPVTPALLAARELASPLLDPLSYFDLHAFYLDHAAFIDFSVYLLLFIAVAEATLRKRFPGRPGKVLSIVVGLMLASALTIAESSLGFSLASLGPVAAGILLLVVALVAFGLLRWAGASPITAAAITLVLLYLAGRAVVPGAFEHAADAGLLPLINTIVALAVLAAIIAAFARMKPRAGPSTRRSAKRARRGPVPAVVPAVLSREKAEKKQVKRELEAPTRKDLHDSKRIIRYLKDIKGTLDSKGASEEAAERLSKDLRRISSREKHLLRRLKEVKRLTGRAGEADAATYRELLREAQIAPELPRGAIDGEWSKLRIEEHLKQLEGRIWQYDARFRYALRRAVEAFQQGDIRSAVLWVAQAIRYEEEARDVFQGMKRMENKLREVAGKEVKLLTAGKG